MKFLYLINRGERPAHHKAPYHQILLCDQKLVAEWQIGSSSDRAWMWVKAGWGDNGCGWLLTRWNGLDIDYGPVVHKVDLPDGAIAGFWRDYDPYPKGVQGLIEKATWWSIAALPEWLSAKGVKPPEDEFSKQRIAEDFKNNRRDRNSPSRQSADYWSVSKEQD